MKKTIILSILTSLMLHAEDYELGKGYHINDLFNIGAYLSTEFKSTETEDTFTLEDMALMSYGKINKEISYLGEIETAAFYNKNFKINAENIDTDKRFHAERFYIDMYLNENLNIRAGKQITPIGIWNLEPINVLRESSSNPLYIQYMFPQFLTGINLSGSMPYVSDTKYNFFGQKNHDLDENYLNIKNNQFFGASIENESLEDIILGGSIGSFIAKNKTTNFIESNLKYENENYVVSTEWMLSKQENKYSFGGYAQGVYNIDSKYSLVGRYEYFNDKEVIHSSDNLNNNTKDQVGVIGFNYRPLFPISFKGEYQFHKNNMNQVLFSLSVLF